jgi:hypothetical protein
MVTLGDSDGSTWSRVNVIWPWCIEAMKTFPILRPMREDHHSDLAALSFYRLPVDFKYAISVEYPISQSPPKYLIRKNRLDPNFYKSAGFYDVDHDYTDGVDWTIHFSSPIPISAHVIVEYLASHDLDMLDDPDCFITVPDEYYSILIAKVICRAYRERLGVAMQDPTIQTTIISQLADAVLKAEESYSKMLADAFTKMADSRLSTQMKVDKFDRVY